MTALEQLTDAELVDAELAAWSEYHGRRDAAPEVRDRWRAVGREIDRRYKERHAT